MSLTSDVDLVFTGVQRWTEHCRVHHAPDYTVDTYEELFWLNTCGDAARAGVIDSDDLDDWLRLGLTRCETYGLATPTIDAVSSLLLAATAHLGAPFQPYTSGNDLAFTPWQIERAEELLLIATARGIVPESGPEVDESPDGDLAGDETEYMDSITVHRNMVRRAVRDSDYDPADFEEILGAAEVRGEGMTGLLASIYTAGRAEFAGRGRWRRAS